MAKDNKRTCIDCHFLAKKAEPRFHPKEVDNPTRHKLEVEDYFPQEAGNLACFEGVWDEYRDNKSYRKDKLAENRRDCGAFYEYQPGAGFEAGQKLRDLESQGKRTEQTLSLTSHRFLLSALGLILSAICSFLTLICNAISLGERAFEFVYKLTPTP